MAKDISKSVEEIKKIINSSLENDADFYELSEKIKFHLHDISPQFKNPVGNVVWVDINKVFANEYNPNSVAKKEMTLLAKSILEDGYTQPVVVVKDEDKDKYVIVDGFHRTVIAKTNPEVSKMTHGKLPVVILDKGINQRIASTVRHNRARGTHAVESMSSLVYKMLNNGMSEVEVSNELGMEPEEVIRLKHITGFSHVYKDEEYAKAWETTLMQLAKQKHLKNGNKEVFKIKEI